MRANFEAKATGSSKAMASGKDRTKVEIKIKPQAEVILDLQEDMISLYTASDSSTIL
jgi:hypothetical protein